MSSFSPRLAETPPEPMPALRWGKSFWHVWDAVTTAVTSVVRGVGSGRRRKKLVLVERIEDLIEQIEDVVRDEPKITPLARKARRKKPREITGEHENAAAWTRYLLALLKALQDRAYAEELAENVRQASDMLRSVLIREEIKRWLWLERLREEDELILLMIA